MIKKSLPIILSIYSIFLLSAASYAEPGSAILPSSFYMGYKTDELSSFSQGDRTLAVEKALDDVQAALSSYENENAQNMDAEPSDINEKTFDPDDPFVGQPLLETGETRDSAKQADDQPSQETPEWLKRTSFGAVLESGHDPRLRFETVQPLYQSPDNVDTLFTQGHLSVLGGSEDYSAGLGYRHLLEDSDLMLGINNFFDYKSLHQHYRTGVGLEAISSTLEFRANSYFGLSPDRLVGETDTVRVFERAANGFDLELGGTLPNDKESNGSPSFQQWLKVFGGLYRYDFQNSKDVSGWKVRTEIKPLPGIRLNLALLSDNYDRHQYQADVRVNLLLDDFRPKSFISAIMSAIDSPVLPSLSTRTLDRVERNFDIKVERWSEGYSPALVVGNLNNVQLVIRFPSTNPPDVDTNGNGVVDAGEIFELDVLMTNLSGSNSTGISYANAVVSNAGSIYINNSANLPDAPSGGTTRTDNATDMDILVDVGATAGTQFNITLDFTADGQTRTLTFGPFTVGSIADNQVINSI